MFIPSAITRRWTLVCCASLILSVSLSAQVIKMYDPQSGEQLNAQELPNVVRFKLENLQPPPPDPNSNKQPRWAFLWDFGDCSFPSTERSPIHVFNAEEANYDVSVMLTPIYSDEDIELPGYSKAIAVTGPYHTDPGSQSTEAYLPEGEDINIINIRDCKPGDLNTFLIPLKNSTGTVIQHGQLTLEYPSEHLRFDTGYVNTCGYDPPLDQSTDPSQSQALLTFNLSDLEAEEERFISVSLMTKSNARVGSHVVLTARLYSDTNGLEIASDSMHLEVVNSHDPNSKVVFKEQSCGADTLRYTIHFENEGSTHAEWVYVIDHIPGRLDMMTLEMQGGSPVFDPVPIVDTVEVGESFNPYFLDFAIGQHFMVLRDTAHRNVAFVFRDIDLPPSRLLPYYSIDSQGVGTVKEGAGWLAYTIQRDTSMFNASGPFGMHADIYFDDNYPIATNAAVGNTSLCYCQPTNNASNFQWIERIEVNGQPNTSGNNGGYADYRNVEFVLQSGNAYLTRLNPGYAGAHANAYWNVWIDLDQNGQFSNNEILLSSSGLGMQVHMLSVPNWAVMGKTVMRISMSNTPVSAACGMAFDGEVEDYTIVIQQPGMPDLGIVDKHIDRNAVCVDSVVNVETVIKNLGPATTTSWTTVDYYLSSDPVYDVSDMPLQQHLLPILQTDSVYRDSAQITMPSGYRGVYYLLALIDGSNSLPENLETNNSEYFQITIDTLRPDLILHDVDLCQPTVQQGTTLDYSLEVQNQGSAGAYASGGGLTVQLYLSSDPWLDSLDMPMDTLLVDSLDAGAQWCYASHLLLPTSLGAGDYYLLAAVDANELLTESNESNNAAWCTLRVEEDASVNAPYFTGFECDHFDSYWHSSGSASDYVFIDTEGTSFQGDQRLVIQSGSSDTSHSVDFYINAALLPQLFLSFHWKDYSVPDSSTEDAILFSDDGSSFQPVQALHGSDTNWQQVILDVPMLATQANLPLTDHFVVRFQHHGTGSIPNDGFAFDAVQLSTVPPPFQAKGMKRNPQSDPEQDLFVYPNPSAEHATLRYRVREDEEVVSIQVLNLAGQSVAHPVFSEHSSGVYEKRLDLQDLAAGVYLCVLQTPGHREMIKMMVSKP